FGDDEPGSGTLLQGLHTARACAERGLRVDVVVVHPGESLRAHFPPAIRLVDLGVRAAKMRRSWRAKLYGSVWALVRYLRQNRPAVLLSSATHINPACALAWRIANVDIRLILRESNDPPKRAIRTRLVYASYHWADAIVAVSQGAAARIAASGVP